MNRAEMLEKIRVRQRRKARHTAGRRDLRGCRGCRKKMLAAMEAQIKEASAARRNDRS